MKKHAFSLFTTLVLTLAARADFVLVNETSLGEIKSTTTMYLSGDKMRTDNGTETSVIMDAATGDMITLMHEQKMVIRMNTSQLPKSPPLPAGVEIPKPKITPTGQREKVNGYDCEIILSELSGMTTKMWYTKDYPGHEKLTKALSVMDKISNAGATKPPVEGMMLKMEYTQQGLKFTTTLKSLTEEKVDPSRFTVPAGYKAPGE
jgi:hypothetical protein